MSNAVIDCFCGAGGLSLGLKAAGLDVRWAFDASEPAIETYNLNVGNHGVCKKAEDITLSGVLRDLGIKKGECFLVAGGPPCQGFSRQRRGEDVDPRNDMVHWFAEFVVKVRPRYFLMENVPALRGPRGGVHLRAIAAKTAEAGYILHDTILNAADYGVPQFRKRFFLVGELADGLAKFEFPKPTHTSSSYATVRDAIGGLPDPETDDSKAALYPNHEAGNVSELNRLRLSHVPPGGGREYIPDALKLDCHRVSVEVAGHRNVYGRLPWDKPANTITTKCNSFTRGMFGHPRANRNITMREAARLQGFPDDFVFLGNRVDVAHQVGNAVPPPLAAALGRALLQAR